MEPHRDFLKDIPNKGTAMGTTESIEVSIANASDETILYRYIDEKAYLEMKETSTKGQLGIGDVKVGAERAEAKTYAYWEVAGPGMSRLQPYDHHRLALTPRGSRIVYVTIKTENGKIIWDNLQQDKKRNIVITNNLKIRTADNKDPYKEHPSDQMAPPATDVCGGKPTTTHMFSQGKAIIICTVFCTVSLYLIYCWKCLRFSITKIFLLMLE